MKSMPLAILWETFAHGRWYLPGMFLLGNGLPLLVYGFLFGLGVNTADPAFVVLQFSFLPLIVVQFAMGTAMAQGQMSRLYTLPISSHAIVAWSTLLGATLVALQTGTSAWLYNFLFHAEWPIVGSMLFAASTWCAILLLQFIPSQPTLSGLGIASFPLMAILLWVTSRYGSWISPPTHYWRELTTWDGLFLAVASLSFYVMTIAGVQFARSGQALPRFGFSKWLIQKWESMSFGTSSRSRFRSAVDAQVWYEFKLKGWGLPFVTALQMVIALAVIAYGAIVAPDRLSGAANLIFTLGSVQSIFALFLGALFAIENNVNPGEKREKGLVDIAETANFESMGSFLSVRPLDNCLFSTIMLWVVAKSVAASCIQWLAIMGIMLWVLWYTNHMPPSIVHASMDAWLVPLNLIGPWICMANAASIAFVAHRFAKVLLSGIALAIGYFVLTTSLQLPRNVVYQLHLMSIAIVSILAVLLTLWVFYCSRRAGLLSTKTQSMLASVVGVMLLVLLILKPQDTPWIAYPIALAIAALVVLPFAAMPLAISASRHR